MTALLVSGRWDCLASSMPERALRPPKLTLANLSRDFIRHLHVYRQNGLSTWTAFAFLFLRLMQHVAYDRGWHGRGR